jgi:hypothetical protein
MRVAGLLRLALVSVVAAACGPEPVVFVEDVDTLTDVLARHRTGHHAVIELAAGTHFLEEVIQLSPGVTLRGDPDGGTVIDGTKLFPRPWRLAECEGKRPSILPQPMVEFTRNTIEDLTFQNGEAFVGPAQEPEVRAIALRDNVFLGAVWEDPMFGYWGQPVIGVDPGNAGCAGTALPHTDVEIEGNHFEGGFLAVVMNNRTTVDGASWTARVRDNVFAGLYGGMVAWTTSGYGDLDASGNQWFDCVGGPNLGSGDAPVLFGIPFGPAADINADGVPDLVFNTWYEPFPLPLAEFTGVSLMQGDPTPEQLPGIDYGWWGPFEDGGYFVLPVRDGAVDGVLFAKLKHEYYDNNGMSLFVMVEHHEHSTFGDQGDFDLLLSGATEFGGVPSADNLTTVRIKDTVLDTCAFGSTLFPDYGLELGCDPGTWGPDQWGNMLVVDIK